MKQYIFETASMKTQYKMRTVLYQCFHNRKKKKNLKKSHTSQFPGLIHYLGKYSVEPVREIFVTATLESEP